MSAGSVEKAKTCGSWPETARFARERSGCLLTIPVLHGSTVLAGCGDHVALGRVTDYPSTENIPGARRDRASSERFFVVDGWRFLGEPLTPLVYCSRLSTLECSRSPLAGFQRPVTDGAKLRSTAAAVAIFRHFSRTEALTFCGSRQPASLWRRQSLTPAPPLFRPLLSKPPGRARR
jgi:hypothetical protein